MNQVEHLARVINMVKESLAKEPVNEQAEDETEATNEGQGVKEQANDA